ncbi:DUF4334 domain-containing protein [Arsenicicoccus dermatophilus]|uniref:DUF4334 domain-containing protein n=1 Tax=Arsenicicoccus dermatophilus TaxID=1076331 RepID=UPI0039170413
MGPGREQPLTPEQALQRYDALPPVTLPEVLGRWRGSEVRTGHPLNGALTRLGWWGKDLRSAEDVHPLLWGGRDDLWELDPLRLPVPVAQALPWTLRLPLAPTALRLARPLLATTRPRARLRPVEHRGVVSTAIAYDHQPIVDHLRRVDEDILLGLMDLRGSQPLYFLLHREPDPAGRP